MISRVYEVGELKTYKYVVVLSMCYGKLMLSRHKQRTTWETQGGHVEPGESIVDSVIRSVPERFHVTIDRYVIMPNHIHAIIELKMMPISEKRQNGW